MRNPIKSITALLLCLFAAPAFSAETFTGKVVGVTDGDTIRVLRDGKAQVIRLYGVDAPESGQAFGAKAKQFVSEAAFGQVVSVVSTEKDAYGRLVGTVALADGRELSQELLREGLAWWYWHYDKSLDLARLEAEAKMARRGIWSDKQPIAPWDFRHPGAATSAATLPAPTPSHQLSAPAASVEREGMVYITRTGAKYHRAGCSSLRYSASPLSVSDAQSRGYTACRRCSP